MNKELRVALAIIAVALVICLGTSVGAFLVARQFVIPTSTTDPVQAAKLGHQIVDYTLPPGFREQQASNAFGYKMVMISAGKSITHAMMITLMEFPAWQGMGREGLPDQFGQMDEEDSELSLGTVTTQTVMIRGRRVTLKTSESTEQDELAYRQAWCSFSSKGGSTVMIMAGGTKDAWDQKALDAFLASIK